MNKLENVKEDLEIMLTDLYSNCKNNNELTKMVLEVSKISFKQSNMRKKELKNGVF